MRILNDAGLAVPNWPVEWGGRTGPRYSARSGPKRCEWRVPEPLAFNASMVGPVIAEFGSTELKERFLPATANLDIWWCQGFSEPEAGSDLARCARPRSATATTTSSTARRPGPHSGSTPTGSSCWPAPTPTPRRSRPASVHPRRDVHPGITVRPIADRRQLEVNEVGSRTSASRPTNSSARRTRAGATRSSCCPTSAAGSPASASARSGSPRSRERAAKTPLGSGTLLRTRFSPPRWPKWRTNCSRSS